MPYSKAIIYIIIRLLILHFPVADYLITEIKRVLLLKEINRDHIPI